MSLSIRGFEHDEEARRVVIPFACQFVDFGVDPFFDVPLPTQYGVNVEFNIYVAKEHRGRIVGCQTDRGHALLGFERDVHGTVTPETPVIPTVGNRVERKGGLFVTHGVPAHIRSDNGPEFTATLVRLWLEALDVETLFIEPGSPWENGYVESFNGKLRDELLDREIFFTLRKRRS